MNSPLIRLTDCAIEIVPGAKLPKLKLYSVTPREPEELRLFIDKNLAQGFIQPAQPVLFWEKKDGTLCVCVNYKGLNAMCVENVYPSLMKDMLAHLAKDKIFTKLDLWEAYYHISIRQGNEWKTAFNCLQNM